jgi:hypothetical protein
MKSGTSAHSVAAAPKDERPPPENVSVNDNVMFGGAGDPGHSSRVHYH